MKEHPEIVVKDEFGNVIPVKSVLFQEDVEGVWLVEVVIDHEYAMNSSGT